MNPGQQVAQKVHHLEREGLSFHGADILADKVEAGFVHADDADGGEVILPIGAAALFDLPKVEARIGVEIFFGEFFQHLALDGQTFHGLAHPGLQALEEILFPIGQVSDTGQIDRHHPDGSGQRIGAEQAPAAFEQFAVVQAQAAAHGAGVLRRHVRVDEVGKVGDAVLGGHLPDQIEIGIVPVEIGRDVIRGNGKGKYPALGVAGHHHFGKGTVDEVHFGLELGVGGIQFPAAHDHRLVSENRRYGKIHGNVGERCLEANPGGNIDIEDKLLERLLHLVVSQFVVTHERRQQRVEIGKGLGAGGFSLERVEKIDDLTQGGAQVLGRCALHLALDPLESVFQQVLQVPSHAVDREQAQIVDVQVAILVGIADIRRIDPVEPVLGRDIRGDVVVEPLQGIAHVAVLFDFPIQALDVVFDQVHVGLGGDAADLGMLFAIEDVGLGSGMIR